MSLPFIYERTLAVSLEKFLKTVIKLTSHKINHSNMYKLVALGTFKMSYKDDLHLPPKQSITPVENPIPVKQSLHFSLPSLAWQSCANFHMRALLLNHFSTFWGTGSLFFSPGLQIFEGPNSKKGELFSVI